MIKEMLNFLPIIKLPNYFFPKHSTSRTILYLQPINKLTSQQSGHLLNLTM